MSLRRPSRSLADLPVLLISSRALFSPAVIWLSTPSVSIDFPIDAIRYFLLQPKERPPMIELIDGHLLNCSKSLTKARCKLIHHVKLGRLSLVIQEFFSRSSSLSASNAKAKLPRRVTISGSTDFFSFTLSSNVKTCSPLSS